MRVSMSMTEHCNRNSGAHYFYYARSIISLPPEGLWESRSLHVPLLDNKKIKNVVL